MGKYALGRKPKTEDIRDESYHFNKLFKKVERIPDVIDLEQWCTPVKDQLSLGSCCWNSLPGGMEFYQLFSSPTPVPPTPVPPTPPVPPIPPTPPDPTGCLTSFINALPGLRAKNKTLTKFVNAQPALWQSIVGGAKQLEATTNYTLLSRLFGYYQTRVLEGTVNEDSGCELRDCMKIATQGICSEVLWPYSISKYKTKPSANCYTAATWKISSYHTLIDATNSANNLQNVYAALASNNPVVMGFTVYESFMSDAVAATGVMPMPKNGEQVEGGHAVLGIGKKPGFIKVRNSWSTSWGDPKNPGDFWMPEAYLTHLDSDGSLSVSDLWVIQP